MLNVSRPVWTYFVNIVGFRVDILGFGVHVMSKGILICP